MSRFLQVAAWKVNLVGQEFVDRNKPYEGARQVEAERIRECDERIKRAEAKLDGLRNEGDPALLALDDERAKGADGVELHNPVTEDVEGWDVDELKAVFKSRAGNRAVATATARNRELMEARGRELSSAEAEVETWRDNRHAAAQEYVQTFAAQAEWYRYMRTRYESLAGWIRMIIDLYWSSNRRVRRSLWRRVAQALFGRWTRHPFVTDPVTVSPPVEPPTWVTEYAYLADGPTSDPLGRIGLATSGPEGIDSR